MMPETDEKPEDSKKTAEEKAQLAVEEAEAEVSAADEEEQREIIEPEEGVEELKNRLAAEKLAREQAELRAAEAARRAAEASAGQQTANRNALEHQIQVVQSGIDLIKNEMANLQAEYAQALSENDYARVADVNLRLTDSLVKRNQLESGLSQMKAAADAQQRQPIQPVAYADPVETLASQLTPRSAAWIRAHPDYARDVNKYNRMVAAHNFVEKSGIQADTDQYFRKIEEMLGEGMAERVAPVQSTGTDPSVMSSAAAPAPRRSAPPPAAPANRGGSSGRIANLSEAEKEIAKMNGQTPQEYQRNKELLIKQGRIKMN